MSAGPLGWAALYLLWVGWTSATAVVLIARDKRQAQRGRWRIPESTLHVWELLGGWPGSWWARRRFRHKTQRRRYRTVARGMALLHVALVAAVVIARVAA